MDIPLKNQRIWVGKELQLEIYTFNLSLVPKQEVSSYLSSKLFVWKIDVAICEDDTTVSQWFQFCHCIIRLIFFYLLSCFSFFFLRNYMHCLLNHFYAFICHCWQFPSLINYQRAIKALTAHLHTHFMTLFWLFPGAIVSSLTDLKASNFPHKVK